MTLSYNLFILCFHGYQMCSLTRRERYTKTVKEPLVQTMTEQFRICLNNGTTPRSAAATDVRDLNIFLRHNVGTHVYFDQFVKEEIRKFLDLLRVGTELLENTFHRDVPPCR
jgi:hypothetical protein